MKKLISIVLVLVFVFALAACGGGADQPEPVDPARPLVDTIEVRERMLPYLNLDSADAAQINEDIRRWGDVGAGRVAHFYAQHGDVLSLILCTAGGDALSYSFDTFNINVRTGELVSNAELLERAGHDFDTLSENLLARLAAFYDAQRDEDGNLPDAAQRNYAKMQSELANPRVPRFFWAQDGRLWWVGQLSFGDGLQISDDHDSFGAGGFFDILIDPAAPEDTYVFDRSILDHTGWDMLG